MELFLSLSFIGLSVVCFLIILLKILILFRDRKLKKAYDERMKQLSEEYSAEELQEEEGEANRSCY